MCREHNNLQVQGLLFAPSDRPTVSSQRDCAAARVAPLREKARAIFRKQPNQKRLSLPQRYAIAVLFAEGYSLGAIAERIGCDERSVERWLFTLQYDEWRMQDQQRSGRPQILTEEEQTLIVARATEDPFVTPAMIKAELDLDCSPRTIDRVLIGAGLLGRVAMKSYPYSDTQLQIRLAFANNLKAKDKAFWYNVFFTDESSLQLGMHANRVYVRRPRGDQFKWLDDFVWKDESKKKSGKIKFFAGFSANGVGKLYFYEKMTGAEMIRIIDENIVPETDRLFGHRNWQILHDNDKRWKCNAVAAHVHLRCITQINDGLWPAYSPDLNPIENLWADLSSRVFDRNPCGVDELKEFTLDEWEKTDPKLLRKLARSMRKRCKMVLENNGGRTKY
jgi:transposase